MPAEITWPIIYKFEDALSLVLIGHVVTTKVIIINNFFILAVPPDKNPDKNKPTGYIQNIEQLKIDIKRYGL